MTDYGRVLLVTPVYTNPPVQGNAARILAFGRELKARGFLVDVVHYTLDDYSAEIAERMRREWNAVYEVGIQRHKPMAFASCWGIDDWCPDELCDIVADLCKRGRYGAVIINYVWLSRALTSVSNTLRVLDTHDLFGDRHRVSLRNGLDPNWYFTTPEEECRAFERADIVIGIQSLETAEIARRTSSKAITVGHPIPPWFLNYADSSAKAALFGYFGSGNPWNVRSVIAFDEAVVRTDGIDWALAGTICGAGLDLASRPYSLGLVAKPEDFYRHVHCCINPMIGGTGLKIKTVEALAYGRPILGTGNAFDGLDPVHFCHRFEGVTDLVDGAREYARSNSLRKELSKASLELYVRYSAAVRRQYDALASMIKADRI